MKLVIVESPAKAKTIQKYLGGDFVVKSSYGHVRDLPKSKMGIDIEHNFTPEYVIPTKSRKYVTALKKAAAQADEIYFATDEDREGEAIAWHLVEILKADPQKIKRITFDEITKTAIQHAITHPRSINQDLVDAQQGRRVLDRLVGYELSPLLWKKVRRGLSAGRVQSAALRLIVEREEEIRKFKPQEYWSITAQLAKDNQQFEAKLARKNGTTIGKLDIADKQQADKILKELKGVLYVVDQVKTQERRRTPPPPFTTSTLQQAAVSQLGFSAKRTMMVAQQLYEGVELGPAGPTGLITYMRTDSTNLASEATAKAKQVISKMFGADYALPIPRAFAKKAKGAQEAHEAIRPTDPTLPPHEITSYLSPDQAKLYRIIWTRMIASQMADARLNQMTADIKASTYTFRAMGTTILFDGFLKVLGNKALKETMVPTLSKDDQVELRKLKPEQHFTVAPARYSEATLVKALEENGIGRPSTYAPIIDVIQQREYVTKRQDKRFTPTEVGELVNTLLVQHFPAIVDIGFTATMEDSFDAIASGQKKWKPVIQEFYQPFHKRIKEKEAELSKKELTQEKTGEICPNDGGELVIKLGRFGKFKACSNFPDCTYTENVGEDKQLQEENANEVCPRCGRQLVVKRGKFGPFLGCSGYPECTYIKKIEKDTGLTCPTCGKGKIVERRSRKGRTFYACNRYPDCNNVYWSKPTGETCPDCGSPLLYGAKNTIRCSNKECKFTKEAESASQV